MLSVALSSDIFEIQRFGGVSRYFVKLAESLTAENLTHVEIATRTHINSFLLKSSLNRGTYLPFSPSRLALGKAISRINADYSRNISIKFKFSIRHETFYKGGQNNLSAKKTVTTVHDLIREKYTPGWGGFQSKKDSLELADAVICVSQNTANDLMEFYQIADDKVFIIPHGVSSEFFEECQSLEERMFEPALLFVGSRDGYKNFTTLIEAFSNSSFLKDNFVVFVIGSRFTKDEELLMRRLLVRQNFKYKGNKQSSLLKAIRSCIALVNTSSYEGFGLPVLEAMASECLVFSTRAGSLGEVGGGNDFDFPALDAVSLATRIESVLTNQDLMRKTLSNGRLHAATFSWTKTARLTADLYQGLLNS